MKPTAKRPVSPLPAFIQQTSPNQPGHWQRTSRLLSKATDQHRAEITRTLGAGEPYVFERSGIRLQAVTMSSEEKKRLAHLLGFERAGFRLVGFHATTALYDKDLQNYFSMQEVTERGFLPLPGIALSPFNTPVYGRSGTLIDVFVPVNQQEPNFYPASMQAAQ